MPRVFRFPRFTRFLKDSRPPLGLFIPLLGLVALLLIAACGGDDPTSTPQPEATNTPQPPPATATQPAPEPTAMVEATPEAMAATMVEVSSQGALGSHLVDADGSGAG